MTLNHMFREERERSVVIEASAIPNLPMIYHASIKKLCFIRLGLDPFGSIGYGVYLYNNVPDAFGRYLSEYRRTLLFPRGHVLVFWRAKQMTFLC